MHKSAAGQGAYSYRGQANTVHMVTQLLQLHITIVLLQTVNNTLSATYQHSTPQRDGWREMEMERERGRERGGDGEREREREICIVQKFSQSFIYTHLEGEIAPPTQHWVITYKGNEMLCSLCTESEGNLGVCVCGK